MAVVTHVLGLIHPVIQLESAATFCSETLGMPIKQRLADRIVLDNASVVLSLVQSAQDGELRLELASRNLEEEARALLLSAGVSRTSEARWVTEFRQELELSAPHGLRLVLAREYNEDELGASVDLSTSMYWEPRAVECVKALLAEIPVAFRDTARQRVIERAEFLATEQAEDSVSWRLGVRAVVQVTPAFKLPQLRSSLLALGLQPAEFEPDFER